MNESKNHLLPIVWNAHIQLHINNRDISIAGNVPVLFNIKIFQVGVCGERSFFLDLVLIH